MNAKELSAALARDAANIAAFLLPKGRKMGKEWKAGSTGGEPGTSLSVCLAGAKAGVWSDFAKQEGGDLLDLWMAVHGLTLVEAMAAAKQRLGIRDAMPERPAKTYTRPAKPACQTPKAGALEWLKSRGLTEETIAAFKVAEQVRDGKTYAVLPYLREGELINAKYRNVAEKRDMRQEGGAEPCLFGWHLIAPNVRTVAITEGEIDAMSLHQVGIPALSVNAGAGNHAWIENDWNRLERFSEILVFFDCDEAGEKGAREIIQRLGPERCRRVRFENGVKDANEFLMKGAEHVDFDTLIQQARPLDPEELRSAADYIPQVIARFYPDADAPRAPTLWLDKEEPWFEFRRGELSVWTGINGHGKSLLLSQVQLGLIAQGESFVVFSGEMKPASLLERSIRQATGTGRPTQAYIRAAGEWMRERYWLFDLMGPAKLARLLEVFTYAHRRYGCSHFVIDSLMMIDVPEDGPGSMTAQKEAVRKLCAFARGLDVHVHLVAHPRKARDESQAPGKLDVAGSGKITDGADNVFSVWRAQKDASQVDDGSPDARLELQKQRNGDVQNYVLKLWYDRPSMQYRTQHRRFPLSFVTFSQEPEHVSVA
ncbi:toprim domain-containing protein [Ottowia testudinis]|uniref:Toprim domain-containing protein n=1 Tax=Ottowia testudinis TaxID=2816950 RepID=A0A975CJH2_9BURK|nr:toprim domain-containing protein [Ottowia testudinis]QTD44563.1 toprim domain-containing protein [Ottowia testudinis]